MKSLDLVQFDTKLTADVVEWQPVINENSDNKTLACATYYLNKELYKRSGILYMLDFNEKESKLNVVDSVELQESGILDMKWLGNDHLITVDSNETIVLYEVNKENKLNLVDKCGLNNDETVESIGLTFDYLRNGNNTRILSSNSKGQLNVIDLNDSKFSQIDRFNAHDYEIWSVLIDRNDMNVIYSGADDCLLKIWDLREDQRKQTQKCSLFGGGVCCILPPYRSLTDMSSYLPTMNEHSLLCSSYDEQIYLIDKRTMKNYVKKSSKLNGGVWRMRVNAEKNLILCACMHTGVHICDLETLNSELYYDKHELNNLAYGCDWYSNTSLIATCSFYNHELRIWKLINE